MRKKITQRIIAARLVAIVRLKDTSGLEACLATLVEAGIEALEITSNTPDFCKEIKKARAAYPGKLIGAGTVINTTLAQQALEAGAQFLVTPNVSPEVIALAHAREVPVMVGALTPTEIAMALAHGADIVKLFPAGIMGLDYVKALLGPFDDTPFFVVGGIDGANAADWLGTGIAGLGIGGGLTKGSLAEMKRHAEQLVRLTKAS